MEINLTNTEIKLIEWEFLATLNSIKYRPSFDLELKNIAKARIREFDIHEGNLSEKEFNAIIDLLKKIGRAKLSL